MNELATKTCIIFFKFKPNNEKDEWREEIEYGRYGESRSCKSAADVIDQLVRYHRQSTFEFKITSIVIG